MTRDETIALFERREAARRRAKAAALAEGEAEGGARDIAHDAAKAVWNAWAEPVLAERKRMEADGRWAAEKSWNSLRARNDATRQWVERAKVDFSRCRFFREGADGGVAAEVKEESFAGDPPVKAIPLEDHNADFSDFLFPGDAEFGSATFSGDAWFDGATFFGAAWFDSATFSGDAEFGSATFSGTAWFRSATFSGDAEFGSATFSGDARFGSAIFSGTARFGGATFSDDAEFDSATFPGNARFGGATFSGTASFDSATFTGSASFDGATFSGNARFGGATFSGDARFENATFSKEVYFRNAVFSDAFFERSRFSGDARFGGAKFNGVAFFDDSTFRQLANFPHAWFHHYVRLHRTKFEGVTSFYAIRGERGFSMANAHFDAVPDFIQAHFEEAPRLDNVKVDGRSLAPPEADDPETPPSRTIRLHRDWQRGSYRYRRVTKADSDAPAQWRALKRLAIQAHDQDREHEFFAREIRSARFLTDWPWPHPSFYTLESWFGFARFWAGYAYGWLSNYGRSILLPLLWWSLGLAVAASFYFGEHTAMLDSRPKPRPWGQIREQIASPGLWTSLWTHTPSPCFVTPSQIAEEVAGPKVPPPKIEVVGLSEKLRNQTSATYEAFQLALRDGFLILYGDADTAHRTYGCLFGVELYGGGTPVAVVPPRVGLFSAIHKLYSAVMIFLFGLALRNMLKMK